MHKMTLICIKIFEKSGGREATNAGDINGKRTDVQNLFLKEGLSGDYMAETHIGLESAWGYPENQACLVVFDDYGNFVFRQRAD